VYNDVYIKIDTLAAKINIYSLINDISGYKC